MRALTLSGASRANAPIGVFDSSDHQTVSLSVTTARSTALVEGEVYRIWSSVDSFIRFGGAAVNAATTDVPITAKADYYEHVATAENFVAGIVSSGTGVLYITKVK